MPVGNVSKSYSAPLGNTRKVPEWRFSLGNVYDGAARRGSSDWAAAEFHVIPTSSSGSGVFVRCPSLETVWLVFDPWKLAGVDQDVVTTATQGGVPEFRGRSGASPGGAEPSRGDSRSDGVAPAAAWSSDGMPAFHRPPPQPGQRTVTDGEVAFRV